MGIFHFQIDRVHSANFHLNKLFSNFQASISDFSITSFYMRHYPDLKKKKLEKKTKKKTPQFERREIADIVYEFGG